MTYARLAVTSTCHVLAIGLGCALFEGCAASRIGFATPAQVALFEHFLTELTPAYQADTAGVYCLGVQDSTGIRESEDVDRALARRLPPRDASKQIVAALQGRDQKVRPLSYCTADQSQPVVIIRDPVTGKGGVVLLIGDFRVMGPDSTVGYVEYYEGPESGGEWQCTVVRKQRTWRVAQCTNLWISCDGISGSRNVVLDPRGLSNVSVEAVEPAWQGEAAGENSYLSSGVKVPDGLAA